MRLRYEMLSFLISALLLLPGCIKEGQKEIYLIAEDAMPPSYALGSSYSCEEVFTMPIENTTARAKKWTSLYKGVGVAIYECKDKKHAEEILQKSMEEESKGHEMKEMIYKEKRIMYNESKDKCEIIFTHYNLFIVILGNSYGKDVKNDTFLMLDWVLYRLGVISEEPEISEEEEETIPEDELKIILDIPRAVYYVGEEFENGHVRVINYNLSRDVEYFILYEMNGELLRTGSGRIVCGGSSRADKPDEMTHPGGCVVMAPSCELNHNPYTGEYDKFWKPGNFTIVIACYNCKDIKKIEDVEDVPPLKVVKKKIIVLEK